MFSFMILAQFELDSSKDIMIWNNYKDMKQYLLTVCDGITLPFAPTFCFLKQEVNLAKRPWCCLVSTAGSTVGPFAFGDILQVKSPLQAFIQHFFTINLFTTLKGVNLQIEAFLFSKNVLSTLKFMR